MNRPFKDGDKVFVKRENDKTPFRALVKNYVGYSAYLVRWITNGMIFNDVVNERYLTIIPVKNQVFIEDF